MAVVGQYLNHQALTYTSEAQRSWKKQRRYIFLKVRRGCSPPRGSAGCSVGAGAAPPRPVRFLGEGQHSNTNERGIRCVRADGMFLQRKASSATTGGTPTTAQRLGGSQRIGGGENTDQVATGIIEASLREKNKRSR